MEAFKGKHKDKECVILTCGPSFTEYPKDVVKEFLKDKIVICVKETIIEYSDEADYFISNGTRNRKFNNINDKTIQIYQNDCCGTKSSNKPTVCLHEDRSNFQIENQLLKKRNFDKYNFENEKKRPWGPGILYETVFYFCLYAGIKNVYTIGWDLIDTSKTHKITHYFENNALDDYKSSKSWKDKDFRNEMKLVNDNIPHFYDYLKEKGMNLFVIGKQSYVNEHIPRKYL